MPISPGLVQLCSELDRFQIATAIGHISRDVFIHWNRSFEDRLGLKEGEMRGVELRSIIVPDAPVVEASNAKERSRQVVHHNVSGNLLAASFAAETAKQKLEDEGRPEAEDLERVTHLIDRAINDLVNAFTSGPPITEQ